ncbi:MAG: ImmA/IrrE family metallo-endopeptidase [Magnetococcus sp. YQC-5]
MTSPLSFVFQFNPIPKKLATVPTFSGEGFLHILLADEPLWGNAGQGVEGFWDGLVDHLAKAWPFLQAEESYPLGHNPLSPDQFLDAALRELRWGEESESILIREEEEIIAFSDRHNLAAGLPDLFLSPIFLLREGNDMRIVADNHDVRLPHKETMNRLEELGNAIAHSIDPDSERGKRILDQWHHRGHSLPDEQILSITTGMSVERIKSIAANDDIFGSPSLEIPSTIQIAARMTGALLFDEELQAILKSVANMKMWPVDRSLTQLQKLAEQYIISNTTQKMYKQGYLLARWLRTHLKMTEEQLVKPEKLLSDWNVAIVNTQVSRDVDAIARWDDKRAGILVNTQGLRATNPWGRRASLAHEIAHLLLDTRHALPSLEILGGRMPIYAEQRANAFAAELLLPRSQVEPFISHGITQKNFKDVVQKLADQFAVGHILAARQLQNYLQHHDLIDASCRSLFKRLKASPGWLEF